MEPIQDLVYHYDPKPDVDPFVAAFAEGVTDSHIYLHDGEKVYAHVPVRVVRLDDDVMIASASD